jgi:hypothetical protein
LPCSLENIGSLTRAAVASLHTLQQLSALTLLTDADLADLAPHTLQPQLQQQPQQQQQHPPPLEEQQQLWEELQASFATGAAGLPGQQQQAAANVTAAASPASGPGGQGRLGLWLPLLLLPKLQELVVGCACRGQSVDLTGTLAGQLARSPGGPAGTADAVAVLPEGLQQRNTHLGMFVGSDSNDTPRPPSWQQHGQQHQQQQQQQSPLVAGLGFVQGAGGRYQKQEGAAVMAYMCPGRWSHLSFMEV